MAGKADHVNAYVKPHYKPIPLNGQRSPVRPPEVRPPAPPRWGA